MNPFSLVGLAIIVAGLICIAPFIMIVALVRIFSGGKRNTDVDEAEESRMVQEIHQGLVRMEERISALETILLDRGAEHPRERL